MKRPTWQHSILAIIACSATALIQTSAMAAKGDCSQPSTNGSGPTASDCAFILRAAVGLNACELCVCDTNDSTTKTAADALICLKKAVGQTINLNCPSCSPTTTQGGSTTTTSTSSTSTSSTTTTLALLCGNNADCDTLPAAFRCNPNNGFCEKPCDASTDCRDFYVCNTTSHYCEQPSLIF